MRICLIKRKPSLAGVAVFPFYPNAEHESKQMECNGNRHRVTSFPEGDPGQTAVRFLCITLAAEKLPARTSVADIRYFVNNKRKPPLTGATLRFAYLTFILKWV